MDVPQRRAKQHLGLVACHACCSLVVWCEYLAQSSSSSLMPLSITRSPALTLAVTSAVFILLAALLHATRIVLLPRGWSLAARNSLVSVASLYVLAVLFGSPLLSIDALAWAAYVGVAFSLHEQRDLANALWVRIGAPRDLAVTSTWAADAHREGSVPPLALALGCCWVGCFVIPLGGILIV
jgi:hypothetical protein